MKLEKLVVSKENSIELERLGFKLDTCFYWDDYFVRYDEFGTFKHISRLIPTYTFEQLLSYFEYNKISSILDISEKGDDVSLANIAAFLLIRDLKDGKA